ncbi:MAG TPA: M28 family peptidase [Gemmatimonadaceae bacterium]|nr:M28 family peptidase [Gemmatimonadaceae bacterium]
MRISRISFAAATLSTLATLVAVSSAHAQRGGFGGGAPQQPAYPDPPALSFPTDDPIIKQIWTMGMDNSHVKQLSQVLFDSLGPRLMGAPNTKAAQDWLVKTYAGWGISAKLENYGTWRGWVRGPSHIDLLTPRVRTLEGQMVGYSPGTGGKNVDAQPIVLPQFADSNAFVKWLPNAKGKLVMVSAPHETCRPNREWTAYSYPQEIARKDSVQRELAAGFGGRGSTRGTGYFVSLGGGSLSQRLDQAGVAGLITSRPKDEIGTMEVFETYSTHVPTIALSCEDYGLVYRLTENNQHPTLRLNLEGRLLGEQPVYNAIATIPGSSRANEYVLLSSHFDSWDGSSGATDNGTGTITMLEAMRILKQVLPHPQRTIIAGHWTGEEEGEVGSAAYAKDHPDVVKHLQGVFNQDNGTGRVIRVGAGGLPSGAEHLTQWLSKLPNVFQQQVGFTGAPVAPGGPAGGGSDDYSFTCYGAPTFGLGALSWDYNNVTWHTERDTYDKVVFDDLKSNATLTAMLAYLASEDASHVTPINPDSARAAMQVVLDSIARVGGGNNAPAAGGRGGRGFGGPRLWPKCEDVPRTTKPRLGG